MHGVSTVCSLLVNAEVDSMGGVIGSEDGIDTKTSPHEAAIENAQVKLRLEYDVREERRRELEYLERGGNLLDFSFGLAATLSVQSTSLTDQVHDQFVTSEAKGSFAVANSPRGDSVDSSGRLGATLACEPNSADNFVQENRLVGNEGRATYPSMSSITLSRHSTQHDWTQHVRESKGSPGFQPNKAYKRRNRSKANRDTAKFSSIGIASLRGLSSSLPSRPVVGSETVVHEPLSCTEMDIANAASINPRNGCFSEGKLDASASRDLHVDMQNQDIKDNGVSAAIASAQLDCFIGKEETDAAVGEFPPCLVSAKPGDDSVPEQLGELNQLQGGGKCFKSEDVVNIVAATLKGLDSESSCTQTSLSVEGNGNMDSDLCPSLKNVDGNGEDQQKELIEHTSNSKDYMVLDDRKKSYIAEINSCFNDAHLPHSVQANGFPDKDEEETDKNQSSAQNEAKNHHECEEMQPNQLTNTITDKKQCLSVAFIPEFERCSQDKPQGPQDPFVHELNKIGISGCIPALELPPPVGNDAEVVDKAHDDRILEEAQIIEVKRQRIKELSIGSLPKVYHQKSHWDFVLEEMAWMANDFAQESLWKRTAASQLCHRAVFASRLKLEGQNKERKDKIVAQTLARAVMEFWQSAGLRVAQTGIISDFEVCGHGKVASENKYHYRNASCVNGGPDEDGENMRLAVQKYMVRFMQHNTSAVKHVNSEAFGTPDKEFPIEIPVIKLLNQHTEVSGLPDLFPYMQEDLFYAVPHGAMEAYRKSIEIYTAQCEKVGKRMQEYVDTSTNDAYPGFGSQENEYEEDEGESRYHFYGAFGGHKQPKFIQKKGKNPNSYTPKSYEVDSNFPFDQCMENRISTPHSAIVRKRPVNGLNNVGSIPTKRVRTASRQRILGPTMGGAGFIPIPRRTDASSGDTNSLQDDQSSLHVGSLIPRGLEVESRMDFDKQSTFDSAEATVKPKKKKKTKYQGEAYDLRWQGDANIQGEQKDHFKRRMECHQFESNGSSGLFAPHAKKPKIMKQSLDNSFENTTLMSGSVPSPVGSQMGNMSNQNKLIKLISGRDRCRKAKTLKMPFGQTGSGSPWSLFEDQALVVLVHDMGPNWELVSDAINSTLYFKCIFRKPKECKERHKILIEKSCGDGADSADDSGSSQAYPSTLPGIPKGGARQLFQQLRGPIEEDTIKSHFEKIILLGQHLHGRKKQDPKQLVPVHGSHATAILQIIPNNVNGGVLTPLDLCDIAESSPDLFSLNYQPPHSSGLPLANQAIGPSVLPSSGTNSLLQVPSGMGLGSNLASPSAQVNSPVSGGRYGVPRTSLPIDEQQRVQQYNPMLSGRNIHQTNTSVSGAFSGNDRGLRTLPGGNGMIMPGASRNNPIPRPALQGISSSPLLTSVNAIAPNMVPGPSSTSMHPGASSGQANSMLQHRDALHAVRNMEHPRQIMPSEMRLKATQTTNQGVASFGGSTSTFLNQSTSPSIPSYPVNHLQGAAHAASSEQEAFAIRVAREQQLQQRILQRQQQQQFPTSGALMSHVPHHPLSNGMQNSSQMLSQAPSQSLSSPSLRPSSAVTPVSSQQQQNGVGGTAELSRAAQNGVGGTTNQAGKQRQRQSQLLQQHQQSGRHHPPQNQLSQHQKQAKLSKGIGKGNMLMHQNLPVDSSHTNGLPTNPGCQIEKGEQAVHLMQGSSFVTQSLASLVHPLSPSHPQQKLYIDSTSAPSKLVLKMPTPASSVPTSHQSMVSSGTPSHNHPHFKVHPSQPVKLVNHSQSTAQREVSQNFVSDSDHLTKPQYDLSQADRPLVNSTGTTSSEIPLACMELTNTVTCVSSAGSAHWTTSDQMTSLKFPISSNHLGASGTQRQPQKVQRPPLLSNPASVPQKQSQLHQVLGQSLPHQQHQSQVQTADSGDFTMISNSSLE